MMHRHPERCASESSVVSFDSLPLAQQQPMMKMKLFVLIETLTSYDDGTKPPYVSNVENAAIHHEHRLISMMQHEAHML